jgi:hypothetical protein
MAVVKNRGGGGIGKHFLGLFSLKSVKSQFSPNPCQWWAAIMENLSVKAMR